MHAPTDTTQCTLKRGKPLYDKFANRINNLEYNAKLAKSCQKTLVAQCNSLMAKDH